MANLKTKKRICIDCGDERMIRKSSNARRCKSCTNSINGKKRYLLNIAGKKFGKLTAIEKIYVKKNGTHWKCLCECGNYSIRPVFHLTHGSAKSCGCLNKNISGKSKTKTYKSYNNMISRCYNKNLPNYARYGALGIKVCDRWRESYLNFLADMGERPDGMTLDRIDSKGNYDPSNCRWSTILEQARNKKNNRLITYGGITASLPEWAEKYNIKKGTLSWRIIRGWSPEEALNLSIGNTHRKNKKRNNVLHRELLL